MHAFVTFAVSALAFAATSTAQTTAPIPGSTVKLASSSDNTTCLGAASSQTGAEVVLADCAALAFASFLVGEATSTSSAFGFKFEVVGSSNPVVCLSARDATDSVPMKFDVCEDDGLQLFEYSLPVGEIVELFETGSCVTNANGSALLAPCSAPTPNVMQRWVFLEA